MASRGEGSGDRVSDKMQMEINMYETGRCQRVAERRRRQGECFKVEAEGRDRKVEVVL